MEMMFLNVSIGQQVSRVLVKKCLGIYLENFFRILVFSYCRNKKVPTFFPPRCLRTQAKI